MNVIQEISQLIERIGDKGKVCFDDPIVVKSSPHTRIISVKCAQSFDGEIFVQDDFGTWHGPLLEGLNGNNFITNSLAQRLRLINSTK